MYKNENGSVDGFLYLKVEKGPLNDIEPTFPTDIRLKMDTFKINAHGTRMGERFIQKALDHALYENVNEVYMTIFPNHDSLIEGCSRYGFVPLAKKHMTNGTDKLHNGDILVIYRTSDGKGPAHYRSVATSICVVEDVQNINNFSDEKSFLKYSFSYSIFSDRDLKHFYAYKKYPIIIKFTYNLALTKRVTRGQRIEELGIDAPYWGFFQLTDTQFNGILGKGTINESPIVY